MWDWEQGRVGYFRRFQDIKTAAEVLTKNDRLALPRKPRKGPRVGNPLRADFAARGFVFKPPSNDYDVWRNHGNIFELALLATKQNDRLMVTDLGFALAKKRGAMSRDAYFELLIRSTYMISPAFERHYDASAGVVYPMCAVIRYLIVNGPTSIDDIYKDVARGNFVGDEPLSAYRRVARRRSASQAENRQSREMISFFAQADFFQVNRSANGRLAGAAVLSLNLSYSQIQLLKIATPRRGRRQADRASEVLRLGSLGRTTRLLPPKPASAPAGNAVAGLPPNSDDRDYIEGNRHFVSHFKIERNDQLRKAFVQANGIPKRCDICGEAPPQRYPWLKSLAKQGGKELSHLHLHHKMPLKKGIRNSVITDLVPLCAGCHSAVHGFYRLWLWKNNKLDFANAAEAEKVYRLARRAYRALP